LKTNKESIYASKYCFVSSLLALSLTGAAFGSLGGCQQDAAQSQNETKQDEQEQMAAVATRLLARTYPAWVQVIAWTLGGAASWGLIPPETKDYLVRQLDRLIPYLSAVSEGPTPAAVEEINALVIRDIIPLYAQMAASSDPLKRTVGVTMLQGAANIPGVPEDVKAAGVEALAVTALTEAEVRANADWALNANREGDDSLGISANCSAQGFLSWSEGKKFISQIPPDSPFASIGRGVHSGEICKTDEAEDEMRCAGLDENGNKMVCTCSEEPLEYDATRTKWQCETLPLPALPDSSPRR